MSEMNIIILVGLAALLLGLIIGIGLHKSIGSSASKVRRLEKELAHAKAQKGEYKDSVAEHFSETANLLNDLTKKYKDIHDHLALGANQLCRDEDGQLLLKGAPIELKIESTSETSTESIAATTPQPPLDYAPKSPEDDAGTLAEEYGLEKVSLHEDLTTNTEKNRGAPSANEPFTSDYNKSPNEEVNVKNKMPPNVSSA